MSMKTVSTITKIGDNPLLRVGMVMFIIQLFGRIANLIKTPAKKNCCKKFQFLFSPNLI